MITANFEFYDHNGLALHSGVYGKMYPASADNLDTLRATGANLMQTMGKVFSKAKTVTIRADVPGQLFPSTLELTNPHFRGYPPQIVEVENGTLWRIVCGDGGALFQSKDKETCERLLPNYLKIWDGM